MQKLVIFCAISLASIFSLAAMDTTTEQPNELTNSYGALKIRSFYETLSQDFSYEDSIVNMHDALSYEEMKIFDPSKFNLLLISIKQAAGKEQNCIPIWQQWYTKIRSRIKAHEKRTEAMLNQRFAEKLSSEDVSQLLAEVFYAKSNLDNFNKDLLSTKTVGWLRDPK